MDYYKYKITTDPTQAELLLALLSTFPFESFLETDQGLEAFLPADRFSAELERDIRNLQTNFEFSFQKELIKEENWNAVWESNFHPVVVDDFCAIRADFHPANDQVEHELIITPKMAFGTGHHETTHLVIQLMKDIDFSKQTVLDYGCGTGILAILASRLKASHIDAVDIEKTSFESTIENCRINKVFNVKTYCGTLHDVPGDPYGIVLANINRNVILDSLSSLSKKIKPTGILVISGFIAEDEQLMKQALSMAGFQHVRTSRRNNWLAMQCLKL